MNKEQDLVKVDKEKILLAEIYKFDGMITIDYPNNEDVNIYELYGFLNCYLSKLEEGLINQLKQTED